MMRWWKTIYGCELFLSPIDVLFGIVNTNNDTMLYCLNFCILLAKKYICDTKNAKNVLFLYDFQRILKDRLIVEEAICNKNEADRFFN